MEASLGGNSARTGDKVVESSQAGHRTRQTTHREETNGFAHVARCSVRLGEKETHANRQTLVAFPIQCGKQAVKAARAYCWHCSTPLGCWADPAVGMRGRRSSFFTCSGGCSHGLASCFPLIASSAQVVEGKKSDRRQCSIPSQFN